MTRSSQFNVRLPDELRKAVEDLADELTTDEQPVNPSDVVREALVFYLHANHKPVPAALVASSRIRRKQAS